MLRQLAENLWVSDSDQTAFGRAIGTRMTAIKLRDGTLWVHSPLPQELEKFKKPVSFSVLPNKWRQGKAGAQAAQIIQDEGVYPWSNEISFMTVQGIPLFNETVFFHKASRTLILCDLGGYLYDGGQLSSHLAMKLLDSHGGWSAQEKKLYVRDRAAYENSINQMFQWDFERVIVAHGEIIEKDLKTGGLNAKAKLKPLLEIGHSSGAALEASV